MRVKKQVHFDEKLTVHVMHAWRFAYHKARCGEWEQIARDRERFRRRIDKVNEILHPILVKKCKEMGIK